MGIGPLPELFRIDDAKVITLDLLPAVTGIVDLILAEKPLSTGDSELFPGGTGEGDQQTQGEQ